MTIATYADKDALVAGSSLKIYTRAVISATINRVMAAPAPCTISTRGEKAPPGVSPELVSLMREALDAHGYRHVRIVVSGGFTIERIREFEQRGAAVDVYGLGSALLRGSNDFTADVVAVEGRPCAKVGRGLRPNPRLERVT